jgi:hypothetical protein
LSLRFFVIIIILLLQHVNGWASAWNLPKNKHQIITETNYKFFKLKSDNDAYIFDEKEFVTTYNHEYGVSDKLTAGVNFFYLSNKSKLKSEILIDKTYKDNYKQNDLKFYLRRQIYSSNNFVFSIQPLANLHLAEIRALLGHSYKVKKQDRFFNIELAYRDIRRKSNELALDFTFGSYLKNNITLINQLLIKYNTDKHLKDKFFYPSFSYSQYKPRYNY